MTKDQWLTLFARLVVLELRPHLNVKVARTIAMRVWTTSNECDPEVAARQWDEDAQSDRGG
jgi:hypothetical protein